MKKNGLFKKGAALLAVLMLIISALPAGALAASLTTSASGTTSISAGGSFTVTFKLSSTENIAGIMGSLSYDSDKLKVTSSANAGSFTVTVGSKIVADTSATNVKSGNFAKVTFKALSTMGAGDSAKITLSGVSATTIDSSGSTGKLSGSGCSFTVKIKASTSSSSGTSGSSTSSTAKKLSSESKLSSLSLSQGSLSPAFSETVTSYTAEVPFEVESVSVKAGAKHSKAKVSVSLPEVFEPGETSEIKVTVTAQNGAKRVYKIAVFRAQDPNYVPSNDSSLTSITPSTGELAPVFSPNVHSYGMLVGNDTEEITFTATTSFKRAGYEVIGSSELNEGEDNFFSIICTAEDKETSTIYVISVRRLKGFNTESYASDTDKIISHIVSEKYTVWDLTDQPVGIMSSSMLQTLKKYPSHSLKLVMRGGCVSIKGEALSGPISNTDTDLTLHSCSIYEDEMKETLASYQNHVFSTHNKSKLAGNFIFCINTDITPDSIVNVYRFDETDSSFDLMAKNVLVSASGQVEFESILGGDFLITEAVIEGAGSELLTEANTHRDPSYAPYYKYIAIGALVLALVVGLILGILIGSRKNRAKKTKPASGSAEGTSKKAKKQKNKKLKKEKKAKGKSEQAADADSANEDSQTPPSAELPFSAELNHSGSSEKPEPAHNITNENQGSAHSLIKAAEKEIESGEAESEKATGEVENNQKSESSVTEKSGKVNETEASAEALSKTDKAKSSVDLRAEYLDSSELIEVGNTPKASDASFSLGADKQGSITDMIEKAVSEEGDDSASEHDNSKQEKADAEIEGLDMIDKILSERQYREEDEF